EWAARPGGPRRGTRRRRGGRPAAAVRFDRDPSRVPVSEPEAHRVADREREPAVLDVLIAFDELGEPQPVAPVEEEGPHPEREADARAEREADIGLLEVVVVTAGRDRHALGRGLDAAICAVAED